MRSEGVLAATGAAATVAVEPRPLTSFRWELDSNGLVSNWEDDYDENAVVKLAGSVAGGVFSGVRYKMDQAAQLLHNEAWCVEIQLENWIEGKMYDRMGLSNEMMEIMGIELPSVTIPVRPGRNLAVIIEIAAMNQRQKFMGMNTAEEFNKRLMQMAQGQS